MTTNAAYLNQLWSQHIIDQLVQLGVTTFALSPGSRSTPLVYALAQNSSSKKVMHFDERGTGFFALGCGKALKKPACIIVTSGSATGNLLPSIMEAFSSSTPLLVITADRPCELHHCGSNQTISQQSMFQKYVRWEINLPPPSTSISINYIRSMLSQAVLKTKQGPVHINIAFREPFFSNEDKTIFSPLPKIETTYFNTSLKKDDLHHLSQQIAQHNKGLIIAGCDAFSPSEIKNLQHFSQTLNFPIFTDILSGLRLPFCDNIIQHHSFLCSMKALDPSLKPSCIIHFGKQYVSKELLYWIDAIKPEKIYHIHPEKETQDPLHFVTDKVLIEPGKFCLELKQIIPNKLKTRFLNDWIDLSKQCSHIIDNFFKTTNKFYEASFFHLLKQEKAFEKSSLFLSNSMPIRNADWFFYPSYRLNCYGSRGVSGIDGNIATAIGIAEATQQKTLAVLGDLATLHDINSLALLKSIQAPVIFFIFNNQGGSIFSFLPVFSEKTVFEKYFATTHSFSFKAISKMFNIRYLSATTTEELQKALTIAKSSQTHLFIEIQAEITNNVEAHKEINKELNKSYAFC